MKYESLLHRLVANTDEPENDQACWPWAGRVDKDGYGRLNVRRDGRHQTVKAHREMQAVIDGEFIEIDLDPSDPFGPLVLIPVAPRDPDCTDDHLCLNRACSNPDHLERVSRVENVKRMRARVCSTS